MTGTDQPTTAFGQLVAKMREAGEIASSARAHALGAEQHYEELRTQLQAICPHPSITERAPHEEFHDGHGFPPTQVKATRRCDVCRLTYCASARVTPLFGDRVAHRVVDKIEFRRICADD